MANIKTFTTISTPTKFALRRTGDPCFCEGGKWRVADTGEMREEEWSVSKQTTSRQPADPALSAYIFPKDISALQS